MREAPRDYRCHFCKEICGKDDRALEYSKHSRWYRCDNCPIQIAYAVGPTSQVKGILFSIKDKDNKNKSLRMEINYKTKQTRIYMVEMNIKGWHPDPTNTYLRWTESWKKSYNETDIITLKKCVNDVTPENALDKINMYILFS
jgi:hypothetical protein